MRFLIFFSCIVILVVIFSVYNAEPVHVFLFGWNFHASLAIVIFLSLIVGVAIGMVTSFFLSVRKKQKERNEEKVEKVNKIEKEEKEPVKTGADESEETTRPGES